MKQLPACLSACLLSTYLPICLPTHPLQYSCDPETSVALNTIRLLSGRDIRIQFCSSAQLPTDSISRGFQGGPVTRSG
ncbi:hypothetical protein E2C01_077004 [Portunus trituberculatus]|uniref:Uncharacterized protein n=1 Tax=Portunus trituberculatus TaxID=210409 RepID=A0A5B7IJ49_PORTR|nr:hypothetical protein [Portunus trituberculatus]